MSSATPLPTALAMVTLPARAALMMPAHPRTELLRKCKGSEVLVVDAAVHDVDASLPHRRAHEHPIVAADQIASFDERYAHLAGQEGVLEVRRVVHPGVSTTTVGS